jgi:multidrug resistance efflux pump
LRYVFWAGVGVVYGDEARGLLQAADAWFARKSLSLFVVTAVVLATTLVAFYLWRRGRGVQEPPPV